MIFYRKITLRGFISGYPFPGFKCKGPLVFSGNVQVNVNVKLKRAFEVLYNKEPEQGYFFSVFICRIFIAFSFAGITVPVFFILLLQRNI